MNPIGQFELGLKQGESLTKGFVLTNFTEVSGKIAKKPFDTEQPSRH